MLLTYATRRYDTPVVCRHLSRIPSHPYETIILLFFYFIILLSRQYFERVTANKVGTKIVHDV